MATLGAYSTTNQYIKYKIYVTENSQNITNNTTNVTVKVFFYRTNTGYTTYGSGTVYCKINGTEYTASVDSSDKITNSGIYLFSKTLNIAHNSDGTKSLAVSAKISHSQFDQTTYQGGNVTLKTIPRNSTLSVANGTLGTEQTLTVTRQSTSFKHRITATCGDTKLYIKADGSTSTSVVEHTDTSIPFTPPLSWASENTTGTSVTVEWGIGTYTSDGVRVGGNTYTKTYSIPSSVKPSCSIAVTDPTGYFDTYGAFIKGLSKMNVVVTATKAYDSAIASYSTKANGTTYTASSFTTGVIASTGTLTISATVKDKRGRSGTASKTITAIDYSAPKISRLTVGRCDADGTANDKGAYVIVTFSGSVTSLNSKNSASYVLKYKKTSASSYTTKTFSDHAGKYSVSNASFIFAADTGSSYDVELSITDDFKTTTQKTSASTAFTLMHFSKGGTGLGIGKIAEEEGILDIGIPVKMQSDWIDLTLNAAFAVYNGTQSNRPVYKERSGIVTVKGCVSPVTEYTSSTDGITIASGIPSKLRPTENLQFVCQGSGMNRWTCSVTTGGNIEIARYGTTAHEKVPTTAWLPFCVTYQV